jgi:hypothetical protein
MDSHEGSQEDPLSLHKYLYCQGNPVNHIDPSGHDLVSIQFTMAIMGQVGALDLHSSVKALQAAQGISGSTDFGNLIYGLDVGDVVMDKVSLALAAGGFTMATVKVGEFLANNAYKFGSVGVKTLDELRQFATSPTAYHSYDELSALIRQEGLGQEFHAHHLLSKVFANRLGLREGQIIAFPLNPKLHINKGGEGINIFDLIKKRIESFGANVGNATPEQIWRAHRDVYNDIGHPEWAEAVYTAYFKSLGITH